MIKEVEIVASNPFGRRIEYFYDDISVGYLDFSIIYDRMEIDNLFVKEEYRDFKFKDVGKLVNKIDSLMNAVEEMRGESDKRTMSGIVRDPYGRI